MQANLNNQKMKKEITTWTALIEATTISERQKLINLSKNGTSLSKTPVPLCISGINLDLSPKKAAEMIAVQLLKEEEEHMQLCQKYNRLGLGREAIIKTSFFKSIIKRIDIQRDLFTFETFNEDGMVLANIKNLSSSEVFFSGLRDLEDYLFSLASPRAFDKKSVEKRISKLAEQMKNDLWPKRTDNVKTIEMRRIPVMLLKAPERTKERIVKWSLKGFVPKITAHRGAITPVVSKDYFLNVTSTIVEYMSQLENKSPLWEAFNYILALLDEKFPRMGNGKFIPGRRNDPILYVNDGEWTVIIDQYADFPKEKEIVKTIKDHYNLLGTRYGILQQQN